MNPFDWRGPSVLRREFGALNLAADPCKRGREVISVDVDDMVKMRREGRSWLDIALKHDCSKGTVVDRVTRAAPELAKKVAKRQPKPASQIVILSRREYDRTRSIGGKQ